MNSKQCQTFGQVYQHLVTLEFSNIRTEHEKETVRFYGEKNNQEFFLAMIDKSGQEFYS